MTALSSTRPTITRDRTTSRRHFTVATAIAVVALTASCGSADDGASSAKTSTNRAPTSSAPALKTIDQAAIQAVVDGDMREFLVPGAVVLLRTPQGEFAVTYGTTERGADTPPTVDTHFRIASITKSMTAAVILQLVQEGTLGLDDPISKYVDGVPNGDDITIAQLLEMRSGLYGFTNDPAMGTSLDQDPTRAWTPRELLDLAFTHPPNFAPGEEYEYSNTNYVLLGLVAEELDGKPLAESMQDRLFGPLGMRDTRLAVGADNSIPAPSSRGYAYGQAQTVLSGEPAYPPDLGAAAEAGTVSPTDFTDVNHTFAYAAGGVTSTATDLATFFEAFVGGKLLDAEYTRILLNSFKPDNPDSDLTSYGYGLASLHWAGNAIDFHGGETVGFNSFAGYDPVHDVTLVVWTNLTLSPKDTLATANSLMVDLLDEIYTVSPRSPEAANTRSTRSKR